MIPIKGTHMSDDTIDDRTVGDEPTVATPPARALAALPARWLTALLDFMRIYPPAGGA
jgi:hypothetical protein